VTAVDHPRYDPLDPAVLDDPYPGYRYLRDHDPVHRYDGGPDGPRFWALSRFADIWDAVRRPEVFSSAQGITYLNEVDALGLAPTMVMLDPPRHTQLRGLVAQAFTPRRVRALEERVRDFVRARIADMAARAADGEPVDLHREFSSPLPTFVLATLLGVGDADRAHFDPWVRALTRLQDRGFATEEVLRAGDAVADMYSYFDEVIRHRRARPGDDLIGALVTAEIDGERLTDWDILGFCFVMVAGGNDTTGNLISHGVALLDGDHAQRERLVADPALVPGAVLEFLRLESSVQALARTTTRPVSVRGVSIPAGEKVMMLFGSGNRDEREFGSTAERLDVTRQIPRHLGFSTGAHFCVGSHLARLQARVAFTELLAAAPRIGVDTAAGRRLHSSFTRGWISLPATGLPTPPA
jgi:cytochrome P450 family 130